MSEDLSEEEKQKKQTRERMRQEYYFAIKEEGNRTFLLLRGWQLKSLTLVGWGIIKLVDSVCVRACVRACVFVAHFYNTLCFS